VRCQVLCLQDQWCGVVPVATVQESARKSRPPIAPLAAWAGRHVQPGARPVAAPAAAPRRRARRAPSDDDDDDWLADEGDAELQAMLLAQLQGHGGGGAGSRGGDDDEDEEVESDLEALLATVFGEGGRAILGCCLRGPRMGRGGASVGMWGGLHLCLARGPERWRPNAPRGLLIAVLGRTVVTCSPRL
jgi:hypothetical protein